MPTLREWLERFLGTVRPRRRDDELAEELRLHMELAGERGRREVGAAQAMESLRDQRGLPWLEDLQRDARQALRSMRRSPGFTAVALVTLALGIGANAAVFTLMNAALLKPLPVRDPETLVLLGDARGRGSAVGQVGRPFVLYSYDLFTHLREANALDDLFAVSSGGDSVAVRRSGWEVSQPADLKAVSGNYFRSLGVPARLGRTIVETDDGPAAPPVAVLNFRYWRDTLNADPSVVGETIDLNGVPVTIAGVAPPEFQGETVVPDPPDVWVPISATRLLEPEGHLVDAPGVHWLYVLGRVKPDVSIAEGQVRLTAALQNWIRVRAGDAISSDLQRRIGNSRVMLTDARRGVPRLRYSHQTTLRVLLGISGAVLLLACANIAGLLLARGMARRGERSMRLALGASIGRLMRQSLAESLTLALAGGLAAVLIGAGAARLLLALTFGGSDVPIPTTPDARVLAFTFVLSCMAAVVFGMLPALRVRLDIGPSMKAVRFRLGKALVIGQAALSLVMLAVAGSLTYGLASLARQPFGFEPKSVLVVGVDPQLAGYTYERLAPLYQQIESRLQALPGVRSAAVSYYSPFNGCCWAFDVTVPGYVKAPDHQSPLLNRVSPRYFETIGTPLVRGRAFSERDTATSRHVAVVNESFARRYFGSEDPIGRTFRIGTPVDLEIVGIVKDAKYDAPAVDVEPMAFLPFFQRHDDEIRSGDFRSNFIEAIQLRAAGDPTAIADSVRKALADIDPSLPLNRVEALGDHISRGLELERATATLAAVFGLLALGLTCVGLYGVMAYLVQRRTAEIGVRVALGAERSSVIGMVMRETLAQAAVGLMVGLPLAFAGTRLIGMGGAEPWSVGAMAAATVLLVASLALAGYVPARRASRVDPVVVLRAE